MADTHSRSDLTGADQPERPDPGPPIRRRRGLRIALLSLASVVVLLGMVVAGGYAYVNHVVGGIHRIPVKFVALDKAAATPGSMTILVTGHQVGPTGFASVAPNGSGLIMLLHLNAGEKAGAAVSLPPQTEVTVPDRGKMQLWNALSVGGPSLLVQTVQSLTGVPIDHYAQVDFNHVDTMVNAIGGVTVTLPESTVGFGHVFAQGANRLNGLEALYYARQTSLTEQGRVLRQQSLLRAVLAQMAADHLLSHPVTIMRVLTAMTSLLTVDSNFSNSQIESLATKLAGMSGASETFITAPTQVSGGTLLLAPRSSQLWSAINHDTVATFAQQNPATVTPAAPQ